MRGIHRSVAGEFPAKRLVTGSFDIFFDLCLNKLLSKQSLGWWFETPSRSLWCHCNVQLYLCSVLFIKRMRAILHSIPVNPPASIFPARVIYNLKPSCAYMVIRGSQLFVEHCFERRCIFLFKFQSRLLVTDNMSTKWLYYHIHANHIRRIILCVALFCVISAF